MLSLTMNACRKLSQKLSANAIELSNSEILLSPLETQINQNRFRVKVTGGGCSGYQYRFSIEDTKNENDVVLTADNLNFEVIVDEHSLPLIHGSTIDHSSSIAGEHFFIQNPNAKANCGCGNSFSV